MKEYWSHLNDRERWMLALGAASLCMYLLYLLLYAPLVHSIQLRSQQLSEKRETLNWMQSVRQHRERIKPRESVTNTQLLTVLAKALNNSEFKPFPYQLQQTESGDIQLSFESVPFNAFIAWLKSIYEKYTFSIKQLNAEKQGKPGFVKLQVTLADRN